MVAHSFWIILFVVRTVAAVFCKCVLHVKDVWVTPTYIFWSWVVFHMVLIELYVQLACGFSVDEVETRALCFFFRIWGHVPFAIVSPQNSQVEFYARSSRHVANVEIGNYRTEFWGSPLFKIFVWQFVCPVIIWKDILQSILFRSTPSDLQGISFKNLNSRPSFYTVPYAAVRSTKTGDVFCRVLC